jgi:hypothetical protein
MQASFDIVKINPQMPTDTWQMPDQLCTDAQILQIGHERHVKTTGTHVRRANWSFKPPLPTSRGL